MYSAAKTCAVQSRGESSTAIFSRTFEQSNAEIGIADPVVVKDNSTQLAISKTFLEGAGIDFCLGEVILTDDSPKELGMTQENGNHLSTKEIARRIEELVTQTPPDVVERMKQRMEEQRHLQAGGSSGELLSKRAG